VLVGSFSKVLTPWLRLGYLVLPPNPALRAAVARIRDDEPCPVPGIAQDAVAAAARERRRAAAHRGDAPRLRAPATPRDRRPRRTARAPLSGLDGGLHAVLGLPDAATSAAVVARLAAEGVAVASLAEYSAVPGDEPPGIVFGYAGSADSLLAEGLARIRRRGPGGDLTAHAPTPRAIRATPVESGWRFPARSLGCPERRAPRRSAVRRVGREAR
jgi:GntR family transcriptional regulator/MocR family aminotransferase